MNVGHASSIYLHILRLLYQFKICYSFLLPALSFLVSLAVSTFLWVYLIVRSFYVGPNDAPLAPTPFEAFVKVPCFLRPHNQIYCTRYCFIIDYIPIKSKSTFYYYQLISTYLPFCLLQVFHYRFFGIF